MKEKYKKELQMSSEKDYNKKINCILFILKTPKRFNSHPDTIFLI